MPLSRFRSIERLPGAAHPAVFRVTYLCDCGDDHVGLVAHDDLDYGPIAATSVEFRNLVTGRTEPVAGELVELTRAAGAAGQLAVELYCGREAKLKPVFPSSLAAGAAAADSELVGVAMHCPSCGELSLNVVSEAHLDVPFYHDRVVRPDRPAVPGFARSHGRRLPRALRSAGFDAERASWPPEAGRASWCAPGAAAAPEVADHDHRSRPRRLAS